MTQAVPISVDVANWYYALSGSLTQVWSSARLAYVGVADASYQTWLSGGFTPSAINTGVAANDQHILNSVTENQVLPGILGDGVVFTAVSSQSFTAATFSLAPVDVAYYANYTSSLGIQHLPGAGTPIFSTGPATFSIADATGTMRAFNQAQFGAFYSGVIDYLTGYYQAVATNIAGGAAPLPTAPVALDGYAAPTVSSGTIALGAGASFVQCTPSGPITITAPASPTNGQLLTIADVAGSASNVNFIQFSGNIDGTTGAKITFPYSWWTLRYYAAGNLWKQV